MRMDVLPNHSFAIANSNVYSIYSLKNATVNNVPNLTGGNTGIHLIKALRL